MNLIYVNDKLYHIIGKLATGEEAIVERLRKAGQPYLAVLPEESFPPEARALWVEVSQAYQDDIQHHNLTVEKATDLAHKLLAIQAKVKAAVGERSEHTH